VAQFVVFTVGSDRPGIVAAVTGAVYELGGNLLDTTMTILSGQFAVALAVDIDVDAATLQGALVAATETFDLAVMVRPVEAHDDATHGARSPDPWVVSVYGADRAGIVARSAEVLARRGVNVVDLQTRVVGASDDPVYAMLLEVELPSDLDVGELRHDLEQLAADLSVSVSLHRADAAIL
jgi:glycine cleavage system transcriptional repressor